MPIMNGIQFIKLMEELEFNIPIVLMSAEPSITKLTKEFKNVEILIKPYEAHDLDNILKKYVNFVPQYCKFFDKTKITECSNDDKEIEKMLFDEYDSQIHHFNNNMAIALNNKNYKNIKFYSHTIKGASYQLGFDFLGRIASKIEKYALDENENKINLLYTYFNEYSNFTQQYI